MRVVWSSWAVVVLFNLSSVTAAAEADPAEDLVPEGVLSVVWGDPPAASEEPVRVHFALTRPDGSHERLPFSSTLAESLGGTVHLNSRRPVWVSLRRGGEALDIRQVASPTGEPLAPLEEVIGASRPWVTLPCRFSDNPDEPENLGYFTAMYGDSFPGLDHFWRTLSYGQLDIQGSLAVDWLALPEPRSHYVVEGTANLNALFDDCVAAADPDVDFSQFEGVQLAFNDDLDCCAWGGGRFATLDGAARVWRVAWLPPWAYRSIAISAHEMGHGLGLPHTENQDGDSNPYDNPWDVMSAATAFSVTDGVFGVLGKHIVTFHKDRLGWLAEGEIADLRGWGTARLDPQRAPSVDDHRVARVRRYGDGATFYLELRELEGYEAALPGEAVIIHQITMGDTTPRIVDADTPPADFSSTEGVMWRDGEIFEDASGIRVAFEDTADGVLLRFTMTQEGPLYLDDLESDGTLLDGTLLDGSGLFHTTSACLAELTGHSADSALFFGLDASCDYDTGTANAGTAAYFPIDLTGVSPPFSVAFKYSLDLGQDTVEVQYFDDATDTWTLLTGNHHPTTPLPSTGPEWGRFEATLPLAPGAATTGIRFSVSTDDTDNGRSGFWIDDLEIGTCPDYVRLAEGTDEGTVVHQACAVIHAEEGYSVGSTGDVTLRAPSKVVFGDGFSVAPGGSLRVLLEPPNFD